MNRRTPGEESPRAKLSRLRASLRQAQDRLAESESTLDDKKAEIRAAERRIRFRLGRLLDQLAELEEDLALYRDKIQHHRNPDIIEAGYLPVEEQFRKVWEKPANVARSPEIQPLAAMSERQLKRMYRKLARRYHPDLAADQSEKDYRTEKMTALNEAYEAGSLAELVALAAEPKRGQAGAADSRQTEAQMIDVLEREIARIERRILLIQNEMENLHHEPVVQLSLEVKLAKRRGQDLLGEIATDLQDRIARMTAERDMLRTQFQQLDGD